MPKGLTNGRRKYTMFTSITEGVNIGREISEYKGGRCRAVSSGQSRSYQGRQEDWRMAKRSNQGEVGKEGGEEMKAAIYCRVSTEDQEREGTSLQSQREACIKKAKELGKKTRLVVI